MPPAAVTAGTGRTTGIWSRPWAVAIIAVAATVVAATQPYWNGPPIRSDGYGYHAWTYAILKGDLNFGGLKNETYAFHETRPGYWWNVYPPGVALIRLPVIAPLVGRGDRFGTPTIAEHVACVILSALALVGTAALLYYTCRAAGVSPLAANVAVLAIVFGTGLFHYATYDCSYSHCWTALGLTALLALAARSLHRGGPISPAALFLLAAWLMLVRNTNVFALGVMGGSYLLLAPRQLGVSVQTAFRNTAWLAAGTLVGIGIQLALNSFAHGRFTVSSYEGELFYWDRPMQWSVLTSLPEHGLVVYYPVAVLLAVVPFTMRRLWPAAIAFVLLLGAYTTLYGYWNMWNLGASFGHRGFVDVLPLGAPLFALALDRLPKWPRRAVIAATVVCIYVTVNLMAGYWRATLPFHQITADTYRDHLIGKDQVLVKAINHL
jgi:hypothetical protein